MPSVSSGSEMATRSLLLSRAIGRSRWRAATALPAGPDATDVVARVRQYLADDLDTPKALAALDGWVADAQQYGGDDVEARGDGERVKHPREHEERRERARFHAPRITFTGADVLSFSAARRSFRILANSWARINSGFAGAS